MFQVLFQNGQRIILQLLNWVQTSFQQTFSNRIKDYSQHGVCKNELSEFTIVPGSNSTPTTPSVTIGDGAAYDLIANRIFISSTDTTTYNSSLPNTTTNDGTGNFVSTPFSTGCVNVPLTVNSFNYLWIDYLGIVDPTIFTLQDITLAKQFYQQSDGYKITVTTVNIAPDSGSIFLGSVNLTGSGVVSSTTISQFGRVYSANLPYRNLIETVATNLLDRTTIYTTGSQKYFLDDHIKAVGTGTVGPQNPHGLSPQDIGLSSSSTIQFHQEFLHSPGIVGISSTVQTQIINITPGFDQLLINPIPANSVVTSNGISLTSTDIPLTTTLQFTSFDAPGTWYIYVDIINKLIARTQTNLISTPNPNQYLIYTVFYTFPDPDSGNGHLSVLTDFRVFGNIATRELQAGSVTGIKINPSALGAALSKDGNNNVQVNVDGTSITINGSNQLEANGSGIAGAGLIATGTIINVNPDNTTINIVSNAVEVANNGITGLQLNPSVAGNGLSGGGGSPLAVNVDNSTIIISGDTLSVGTITSGQISDGAVSTRISFPFSFSGGISTTAWQVKQVFSFVIPSTTQPVLVQWDFRGSFTQGATIGSGIALAIDDVPMVVINATSAGTQTFPPTTFPATIVAPLPEPIVYVPSFLASSGIHSIQIFAHGQTGTGGGSMTASGTVTIMLVFK